MNTLNEKQLNGLTKAQLIELTLKAIETTKKATAKFKDRAEILQILEENKNGSFTISNFIEDELIVKMVKNNQTEQFAISQKYTKPLMYALFENAIYLIKSKEYFTVSVNDGVTIGNAQGNSYFVSLNIDKIPENKKAYLNNKYDLNLPLKKQDDRLIRNEELEEINAYIYGLTGKSYDI